MSPLVRSKINHSRDSWRGLLLLLLMALVALTPFATDRAAAAEPEIVVGQIDGAITPVMARYVERVIDRAAEDGAAVVVFEMDTPGGLSSAMDDIVRDIIESDVPVVVYVGPRGARAASAGVYIAYAAHVSAMAPGTNIGSASPIFMGDDGTTSTNDETLTRKVTNDAVSQIKNLAELRGRNAVWAELAVRDAVNITADEALALGVIDLTAPDLDSLLARIDGRTVALDTGPVTLATASGSTNAVDMSVFEQFLQLLADPTIAYLLISLGMLGIYLELSHPGITFPGIFGAVSVLLGLFALGTVPVNWAGILLIALAFILFAVDLFVPSFGTLTIGGLVCFVLGSYLLVGEDAPPGYEIAPPVIWAMTACLIVFSLFLAGAVLKARLRRPATGREVLIGALAVVRQPLAPDGMVLLQGERWHASVPAGSAPIASGEPVIVTAIHGLRLSVRAATGGEAARLREPTPDRATVIPVSTST